MNRILIGIAILVAILVGGALAAPSFIDWNQYRTQIAARVEQAVGRPVAITGDISFSLLPQPALSVHKVRIANASGAAGASLVALASLDVKVAFGPLVRGAIEVRQVVLREPVFDLEQLADGTWNWQAVADAIAKAAKGSLADDLKIDSFTTRGGTVFVRQNGTVVRLDAVSAELAATTVAGPFSATADFTVGGFPLHMTAAAGVIDSGKPLMVRADVTLTPSGEHMALRGALSEPSTRGTMTGTVTGDAKDLAAFLGRVSGGNDALPPFVRGLSVAATATAQLTATIHEVDFNNLQLKVGDTGAAGAVSIALDQRRFDATLAVNQLDVDAILTRGASERRLVDARGTGAPFALPAAVNGSLALTVEAATYRQRLVRQVELAAALNGGTIAVSRLHGLLPGVSEITADGTVTAVAGLAQFDGAVEAHSDNLRELLAWLAVPTDKVPADRLRSAVFDGRVRLRRDLVQAYGATLQFDGTTVQGAAAYAVRDRAAFSVDLDIDRLEADAYRVLAPATFAVKTLETFDTDIRVRAGEVTLFGHRAGGVVADIGLLHGALTAREFSVADVAGTHFTVTGIATGFADKVSVTATVNLAGDSPAGVAMLANIDLGGATARLGAVTLNANVDGDEDALRVDAGGTIAGTDVRAKGTIKTVTAGAVADLVVDAANPNVAELLRRFGLGTGSAGSSTAMAMRATVAGPTTGLSLALSGQVAGADVQAAGTVAAGNAPRFNLTAVIGHSNGGALWRNLGLGRQAPADLGAVSVRLAVDGTPQRFAVELTRAALGSATLQGTGTVDRSSGRTRVAAKVIGGRVALDTIFPPGPGAAAGEWSTAVLPLALATRFDLDLDLGAEQVNTRGITLSDPHALIHSTAGTLAEAQFRSGVLGGTVDGKLSVTTGPVPIVALDATAEHIDLALARPMPWALALTAGQLDGAVALQGRGRTMAELAGAVSGTASATVTGGAVRGIDVTEATRAIPGLRDAAGVTDLLQRATAGGTAAVLRADMRVRVAAGVATVENFAADIADGRIGANGTIDLPARRTQLAFAVGLTGLEGAPPFSLDLSGPWSQPRRQVLSRELQAFVAKSIADRPPAPAPVVAPPAVAAPVAAPAPAPVPAVPLVDQLRQVIQQGATPPPAEPPPPPPAPADPLQRFLQELGPAAPAPAR